MKTDQKYFPATVIKIINEYKIVINRGSIHGVRPDQRFLIYSLSEEELKDPETGESLGHLEIVKGIGRAIHVQDKLTTLHSDKKEITRRKIIKRPNIAFRYFLPEVEEIIEPTEETEPFEDVEVGDKAKPI